MNHITDADYSGASLRGEYFTGRTIRNSKFSEADLKGSYFDHSTIHFCKFKHSDLSGASFVGAKLLGVSFIGANLCGVNFQDANLSGVDLSHANLMGAQVDPARCDAHLNLFKAQQEISTGMCLVTKYVTFTRDGDIRYPSYAQGISRVMGYLNSVDAKISDKQFIRDALSAAWRTA